MALPHVAILALNLALGSPSPECLALAVPAQAAQLRQRLGEEAATVPLKTASWLSWFDVLRIGWWFGRFFGTWLLWLSISIWIGTYNPNWLSIYRGVETTNQLGISADSLWLFHKGPFLGHLWWFCWSKMVIFQFATLNHQMVHQSNRTFGSIYHRMSTLW